MDVWVVVVVVTIGNPSTLLAGLGTTGPSCGGDHTGRVQRHAQASGVRERERERERKRGRERESGHVTGKPY